MLEGLLTPDDLAEMLGVKKSTVYQWTHVGYVPHVKIGRFVRFRRADVKRWLSAQRRGGKIRIARPLELQ